MLMDILGALIGFVAIILLLSLIVTALVQMIEHLFHMRARNLKLGLEWVLEECLDENGASQLDPSKLTRDILNRATIGFPDRLGPLQKLVTQPVTWIEPTALGDMMTEVAGESLPLTARDRVVKEFERVGDQLSKRFTLIMRIVTAVVAAVVAIVFQISATQLLTRLSSDAEFRTRAVALGEQLGGETGERMERALEYENVSETALRRLQENHPDLTDQIEEAAGIGEDKDEIVAELKMILCKEVPDRCESVVKEYEDLLDDMHKKGLADARAIAGEAAGMLSQIDVTPWPLGWRFYADVGHCAGVFATIILLGMGAPFWFEMLRNILKLRDVLQPKSSDKK